MDIPLDIDPIRLQAEFWPQISFYKEQRDIIYSVWENDETYVPAGNKLGKDYTAGFICLAYFLTRHPCRIVTTSAKEKHLTVLWGEINSFIETCKYPLDVRRGGPLVINHMEIRKIVDDRRCPKSYILGMVASSDTIASMQGHHIAQTGDGIPRTLFVGDESSSLPEDYFIMARTWCNRLFSFGNTWPCSNSFKYAVDGKPGTDDRGGDIPDPYKPNRYWRKVLRITATDSPNVRYGLAQEKLGYTPTDEFLIPGVKSYGEYKKQLLTLDEMERCVILDAKFYKGKGLLLFPPDYLAKSEDLALALKGRPRQAKAIGIDTAEGGDNTVMTAVDELGVIEQVSKKTPDTNVICREVRAFGRKHNVPPEKWCFDRGGGGKEHADRLRGDGLQVRTVAFGESLKVEIKRSKTLFNEKKTVAEDRYTYFNRRAELFGELSLLCDPARGGFAIPKECVELHRQLGLMPKRYDDEGRLKLPPKQKTDPNSEVETLRQLLGCSPDEADSLVIAVHAMLHKTYQARAGAVL